MRAKANLVVLDIDVFGDGLSLAITNAERGEYCLGFYSGIRGTEGREDASEHFRRGYGIGKELAYRQALKKRKCTEAGKKGRAHRLERLGLLPCDDDQPLHPTVHPTVTPYGEAGETPELHPTVHPTLAPCGAPSGDTTLFFVREVPSGKESTEVLLELPCQGGKTFPLTREELDRWREAYPHLDAIQQAKAMKFWLESNKDRQKTVRGMGKFISGWLSRETERQPKPENVKPLKKDPMSEVTRLYLEANPEVLSQGVDHAS